MKTLLLAAALVAALAPAAVSAQTAQRVQPVKQPQPLTAEQRLAKLSPAQRAEFEAKARMLGLDPKALAAQDLGTANRTLEAKKLSSGGTMAAGTMTGGRMAGGTITGDVATASTSRDGALPPSKDPAAKRPGSQDAASLEERMRQQQEAMAQLAALLKRMHETQQQIIGNMR